MKNSYLQPVSKSLSKRSKKIIYADELKGVIKRIMKEQYSDKKAYKLIYHLKNKGFLISLKKTIFFIKKPEEELSESLLIEDWYWIILHGHCTKNHGKDWYVGGLKALELHLGSIDAPDTIDIICPDKQSVEVVIASKHVHFKKYSSKKIPLFKQFKKRTHKYKFGRYSIAYAQKELALLETLYNFDKHYDRYAYEFVKKFVKKHKEWDGKIREAIIKASKHHTSINRLYTIAKEVNKPLSEKLLVIIKKYSFVLDT